MRILEDVLGSSRFLTMTKKDGLFVIEVNFWPSKMADHTVNIRVKGRSIEEAVRLLVTSMKKKGVL